MEQARECIAKISTEVSAMETRIAEEMNDISPSMNLADAIAALKKIKVSVAQNADEKQINNFI